MVQDPHVVKKLEMEITAIWRLKWKKITPWKSRTKSNLSKLLLVECPNLQPISSMMLRSTNKEQGSMINFSKLVWFLWVLSYLKNTLKTELLELTSDTSQKEDIFKEFILPLRKEQSEDGSAQYGVLNRISWYLLITKTPEMKLSKGFWESATLTSKVTITSQWTIGKVKAMAFGI